MSPSHTPRHIAIVMDGNGRWASARGWPRVIGHRRGARTVHKIVEYCARSGIECLTLFAFSTENWQRPEKEVRLLMQLFRRALRRELVLLQRNNIRLRVIGETARFDPELQNLIHTTVRETAGNTGLNLTVAANYGGRWDILQACRRAIGSLTDSGAHTLDEIDGYLSLAGLPDPDLFIRTGGEQRLSNFLIWQLAHTRLHFSPTLWPDFSADELGSIINSGFSADADLTDAA